MSDEDTKKDKVITLNEQIVTEEELQKKIERSKTMKGVKIVEIAPGQFVQRIEG